MVQVESGIVFHTSVAQAEGHAGRVLGGGPHHVGQDPGDVHGACSPLLRRFHGGCRVIIGLCGSGTD